jgi:hypothetical protein
MNTWLGCLICVFRHHILSDTDEDELYKLPHGERFFTMCERCHMPLVCYVEPKHPELYKMVEDV